MSNRSSALVRNGCARRIHWVTAAASLAAAALSDSALAATTTSPWSKYVGKILPSDETVYCEPTLSTVSGTTTINSKMRKLRSDGTPSVANYTDNGVTKVAVKMDCQGPNGWTPASSGYGNTATATCPTGQVGSRPRCSLQRTDSSPFTYGDALGNGDPCGNDVSAIVQVPGTPVLNTAYKGQVTGQQFAWPPLKSELNYHAQVGDAVFNHALMVQAQVMGTDLGHMFYAGGKLNAGYGDTWKDQNWGLDFQRGSVLFQGTDLDASDGLAFSTYDGSPSFARDVLWSCHDENDPKCNERTAIATAGFGITEGTGANATAYRILWFNSIGKFDPFSGFKSNHATLAWSTNGQPFERADKPHTWIGTTPPQWEPLRDSAGNETAPSYFGAGSIFLDRHNGYAYFIGVNPYATNSPVRLAKVKANFASIMDQTKYQYWGGPARGWVSAPPSDPLAPSRGTYFGSEANLLPATENIRPEFSVTFDAYANRFVLLAVSRPASGGVRVKMWTAPSLTGTWTAVTTGQDILPNNGMMFGQYLFYDFFYGPYAVEQLMKNAGQSIYFQLSEWNGLGHNPYNSGLWGVNVTRKTVAGCIP